MMTTKYITEHQMQSLRIPADWRPGFQFLTYDEAVAEIRRLNVKRLMTEKGARMTARHRYGKYAWARKVHGVKSIGIYDHVIGVGTTWEQALDHAAKNHTKGA